MAKIGKHIGDRLTQVANFLHHEAAEAHIANGEVTNPFRALALRGILHTPGLPEYLYRTRVARPYERIGRTVIGSGANAIVLADGDTRVQKVYTCTRGMTEAEQRRYIASLERKQTISARHLGDAAVLQAFAIESDPLIPDSSIVAASQWRVHDATSISLLLHTPPEIPAFTKLMQGSRAMLDADKALPDVVGSRNLLLVPDGQLLVIDPFPLEEKDPHEASVFFQAHTLMEPYLPIGENRLR